MNSEKIVTEIFHWFNRFFSQNRLVFVFQWFAGVLKKWENELFVLPVQACIQFGQGLLEALRWSLESPLELPLPLKALPQLLESIHSLPPSKNTVVISSNISSPSALCFIAFSLFFFQIDDYSSYFNYFSLTLENHIYFFFHSSCNTQL